MKAYGTTAGVILAVLLAYAAMMFGVSLAGLFGEGTMFWAALLAIAVWVVFGSLVVRTLVSTLAVRRGGRERLGESVSWTSTLPLVAAILSIVTAFLFGFGAFAACGPVWLAGFYHWMGLAGSLLGFTLWFTMPLLTRESLEGSGEQASPHAWRTLGIIGSAVYGVWGVVWLVAWLMLRGSIDTGEYPARASSDYQLPFPAGDRSWIIQGNNSSFNHEGREEYAWDFRRQCGTPVLAARSGEVLRVTDTNSGHGKGKANNIIEVDHGDGTVGRYLHIQRNSGKVSPGDRVSQGEQLASVGNVGNSLTGHIHFDVMRGGNSIPIAFQEVDEDSGIPRTFERYSSGNR